MKLEIKSILKKPSRKNSESTRVNSTNLLLGITKKNETNNEVQSLITKMSNDEFEKKINF